MTTKSPPAPERQVQSVKLDRLQPHPDNPRFMAADATLVKSIRDNGIEEPLHARWRKGRKTLQILRGHRRFSAATEVGLSDVPVIALTLNDEEAIDYMIRDHFESESLHPLEEAQAIRQMIETGLTMEDVAARFDKPIQAMARRAKLLDLSPKWQQAIRNGIEPVVSMTAKHLELVAPWPTEVQDHLLSECDEAWDDRVLTIKGLKELIQRNRRLLASAPFDTADETLQPKCGSCLTCMLRSDREVNLFDDVELGDDLTIGNNAVCLSPDCYDKKAEIGIKRKFRDATREHPGITVMAHRKWDVPASLKKAVGGEDKIKHTSNGDLKKRAGKDTVPVFIVDGPNAGTVMHMRPQATSSYSSKRSKAADDKPTPLKERRRKLQRRRMAHCVQAFTKHLEGLKADDLTYMIERNRQGQVKIAALILAFGTIERDEYGGIRFDDRPMAWDRYKGYCDGNVADVEVRLVHSVIQVWLRRLHFNNNDGIELRYDEMEQMCDVLAIEFAPFMTAAEQEIAEPASWAKLNADGTPKAAKMPRKKAETKKKTTRKTAPKTRGK